MQHYTLLHLFCTLLPWHNLLHDNRKEGLKAKKERVLIEVFLPNLEGYASFRVPTEQDFQKVCSWGIAKGQPFEEALAFYCMEAVNHQPIFPAQRKSYEMLRGLMIMLDPTDHAVYVEEVMKALVQSRYPESL